MFKCEKHKKAKMCLSLKIYNISKHQDKPSLYSLVKTKRGRKTYTLQTGVDQDINTFTQ